MMKQGRTRLTIVLALVYAVLVYSSYGLLVHGAKDDNNLHCTYFTGISLIKKDYTYAESGLFGRSACPRTIYFGEEK